MLRSELIDYVDCSLRNLTIEVSFKSQREGLPLATGNSKSIASLSVLLGDVLAGDEIVLASAEGTPVHPENLILGRDVRNQRDVLEVHNMISIGYDDSANVPEDSSPTLLAFACVKISAEKCLLILSSNSSLPGVADWPAQRFDYDPDDPKRPLKNPMDLVDWQKLVLTERMRILFANEPADIVEIKQVDRFEDPPDIGRMDYVDILPEVIARDVVVGLYSSISLLLWTVCSHFRKAGKSPQLSVQFIADRAVFSCKSNGQERVIGDVFQSSVDGRSRLHWTPYQEMEKSATSIINELSDV